VSSDVVVGAMTTAEFAVAIDWAAAEGWDPGRADATCFHAADPLGPDDFSDVAAYDEPCFGAARPAFLFADDETTAWRLFAAIHAHVGNDAPVSLDVPASHAAAVALAERLGMTVSVEKARMYVGGRPVLAEDRMFGITSYELG